MQTARAAQSERELGLTATLLISDITLTAKRGLSHTSGEFDDVTLTGLTDREFPGHWP